MISKKEYIQFIKWMQKISRDIHPTGKELTQNKLSEADKNSGMERDRAPRHVSPRNDQNAINRIESSLKLHQYNTQADENVAKNGSSGSITKIGDSIATNDMTPSSGSHDSLVSDSVMTEFLRCVPMMSFLEPMVHHLIKNDLISPEDVLQIARQVDDELMQQGMIMPSNLEIPQRNEIDGEHDPYFDELFAPPLTGVDDSLRDIRKNHQELLLCVVKACKPYCPYDIVVSNKKIS